MNLSPLGWRRVIQGARQGDQSLLLTGLGLVLFEYLRHSKPKRKLLYRKKLPVGSTVVVRHGRRGEPRLEIHKPPRRRDQLN